MLFNYSFNPGDPSIVKSFAPGVPLRPTPRSTDAAIPGGIGATAVLPGPAAGFVRYYGAINMISNTLAAPLANVTVDLLPGPIPIQAAQSGAVTLFSSQPPILFPGESFQITNGGANPGLVYATFLDVPITTEVPVRMDITDVPATLIPAYTGPAALANQLITNYAWGTLSFSQAAHARFTNLDSIAHQLQIVAVGLGGLPIMRTAVAAAGGQFVTSGAWNTLQVGPASGDLQIQLTEPVATVSPKAVLAYQTLAI